MPQTKSNDLRLPAEVLYAEELDALIKAETHPVQAGWRLSPRSVLTYICGGKCGRRIPPAQTEQHWKGDVPAF